MLQRQQQRLEHSTVTRYVHVHVHVHCTGLHVAEAAIAIRAQHSN
jgi:hypothetical protein